MKNKNLAIILAFFGGGFGIHKFYLGENTPELKTEKTLLAVGRKPVTNFVKDKGIEIGDKGEIITNLTVTQRGITNKQIKKKGLLYSMATVSPKNKYSLMSFLKHDYEIIKIKKKYSGVKRLILIKKHNEKE